MNGYPATLITVIKQISAIFGEDAGVRGTRERQCHEREQQYR
jgi:hypothetical protein